MCYNSDEKFGRGHNLVCKRLFPLEGAVEEEEDSTPAEEDVSLHAIAGLRRTDTMQIRLRVGQASLMALLDSGSTHNFITEDAARRTGLPLQHRSGMMATVANGEHIACLGTIRQASFTIDEESFHTDLFVLPLAGYDVVLGTQWLAMLEPILWDFGTHTLTFRRHRRKICWREMAGPAPPGLFAASANATLLDALLHTFDVVFAEPCLLPPPV